MSACWFLISGSVAAIWMFQAGGVPDSELSGAWAVLGMQSWAVIAIAIGRGALWCWRNREPIAQAIYALIQSSK